MGKSFQSTKVTLKAEKENVDPGTATSSTAILRGSVDADEESLESYGDHMLTSDESADESDSQSDDPAAAPSLPPSPPLNRTPISKVFLSSFPLSGTLSPPSSRLEDDPKRS